MFTVYLCELYRCNGCRPTFYKQLDLQALNIHGNILRIDCKICKYFIAAMENNKIINIDEIIDANIVNGWKRVICFRL